MSANASWSSVGGWTPLMVMAPITGSMSGQGSTSQPSRSDGARLTEPSRSPFNEAQYQAVAWMTVVINTFNRLGVSSRPQLPSRPS